MTFTQRIAVIASLLALISGRSGLHAQDDEAPDTNTSDTAESGSSEVLELPEEGLSPEALAYLQKYAQIQWDLGPTTSEVGSHASIDLPEGYKLTGPAGSRLWDELTENPPSDTLATLMPDSQDWFVCFTFSDDGYVKDDEANELDADAIMDVLRAGMEQSNAYREERGWTTISVTDWIVKPKFDQETKNLVWAFGLQDQEGNMSANYNMRVLGRYGVMNVIVVADPLEMDAAVDEASQVLAGFSYNEGHRYAEFQEGDKIAEYGLTGLIAGGALVAAAKTGLLGKLAKFAKVIIIGLIAAIGGIWRFLTGQTKQEDVG